MTGRIGRNLRQGHRAESAGIDLLRPFCAVANVPQSEDIGFDAVATLLRRDGASLYAEDSFCVQFKASSVRSLEYHSREYEWFSSLTIPLFIGSVNLESRVVSLFTTHRITSHPNAQDFRSVVMHLDDTKEPFNTDMFHCWLGPPILEWTTIQAESRDFHDLAYRVLKEWSRIELVNTRLRPIRMTKIVSRWQTNEVPTVDSTSSMSHPDDLTHDLETAYPYLFKIACHLISSSKEGEVSLEALGAYLLAIWMKDQGVVDSKLLVEILEFSLGVRLNGLRLQLNMESSGGSSSAKPHANA